MYDVHLGAWAHWKARSLDVTAEALQEKIDRKSAILLQRGQFDPKFQVEGDVPHQ